MCFEASGDLLIQMQNISCKVQACKETKTLRLVFGFESDTAVYSSLAFYFPCLIFFSFAGHLVGFILVGKVFRKAFRILGLDERKGRWAMEQDFHGDLQVNLTWFFAFFSGVLD